MKTEIEMVNKKIYNDIVINKPLSRSVRTLIIKGVLGYHTFTHALCSLFLRTLFVHSKLVNYGTVVSRSAFFYPPSAAIRYAVYRDSTENESPPRIF